MLHKILCNIDHPLHSKLPQFAKPIRITRHTTQQNDKAFVFARYNIYQFSLYFIYSNTRLWNILHNEMVLAIKHDRFIVLAKKIYMIKKYY